jgi:uncharacterized protein YegL
MSSFVSKTETDQWTGAPLAKGGSRRLPLYFMLDFSCSAREEFVKWASQQVEGVANTLKQKAEKARKIFEGSPVFYTVIAFRSTPLQLQPLAAPWNYHFESLKLGKIRRQGSCALGKALALLGKSIEQEVVLKGVDSGDVNPMVLLFVDGTPSDDWVHPLELVVNLGAKVFVCESLQIASRASIFREKAGKYIAGFLSSEIQSEILNRIEEGRQDIIKHGRVFGYPTIY